MGTQSRRAMVHGAVLVLFLLYAIPGLFVVLASLKTNEDIVNHPAGLLFAPTLQAYRTVLDSHLVHAMLNSLQIALGSTALAMILGVPLAFVLARLRARWSGLVVGILIALQMMPTAVSVIPLYRVLALFHLLGSLPGVIVAITASVLPFAVLLLRPFFLSVPREIEEAAEVDGAGEFRSFVRVVLPVVRNGLSLIGVLLFIGSWGEFLYCISFLNDTSRFPLSVLLVQQQGFYGTQWNNLMALALVGAVPTLILFVFVARRLTSGLALGYGK